MGDLDELETKPNGPGQKGTPAAASTELPPEIEDLQAVDRYLPLREEAAQQIAEVCANRIPDQITRMVRLLSRVASAAALMSESPANRYCYGERTLLAYDHEAAEAQLGIAELFENLPAKRAVGGGDLRRELRQVLDEARTYLKWCTENDGANHGMATHLFQKWDDILARTVTFVRGSKEDLEALIGLRLYVVSQGQAGGTTADGTAIEHIQLENGAYKILHTLRSSPTRLHQEDLTLCEDPRMDRKTVSRHLTTLAEHGLIDYNPRDKKGAAITEKGRAYLNGSAK